MFHHSELSLPFSILKTVRVCVCMSVCFQSYLAECWMKQNTHAEIKQNQPTNVTTFTKFSFPALLYWKEAIRGRMETGTGVGNKGDRGKSVQ